MTSPGQRPSSGSQGLSAQTVRPSRSRREAAVGALLLLLLAAACFSVVRPTNFGGSDEWLCLSLLSQGILDFPYANRPLNLVWGWPAWWLRPDRLDGFLVLHVLWIGSSGVLVFLIVRRLLPRPRALAFLAGALTIVWAPTDGTRLCAVHMIVYSGCTFGGLLASFLVLEAFVRRRPGLAVAALAVAAVAALSTEAALAPLPLVPLLFVFAGGLREPRRLAAWTLAVLLAVAAGGARATLPYLTHPERVSYQAGFVARGLSPVRLVAGSLGQLRRHVAPVFEAPSLDHAWPTVPLALVLFLGGLGAVHASRLRGPDEAGSAPVPARRLLVAAAFGGLWALAAYLPLAATTRQASRTQFLSAPGVAVLLAAGVAALSALVPKRARLAAVAVVGAWIVAMGAQRTAALQARWDGWSAYPAQRQTLLELAAIAPDPAPGTLFLLLPHGGAWPLDLTFRQAVRYLYEGRACGHVVGADTMLYETRFEPTGVRSTPEAVVRGPWHEDVVLYPYASVVALRQDGSGRLSLLEDWPDELPPLPAGATYAPRDRLGAGAPPRRLSLLGS
jgi:hypothetical protein